MDRATSVQSVLGCFGEKVEMHIAFITKIKHTHLHISVCMSELTFDEEISALF